MKDPTRVLIVDDEPLARAGLRKLCERDPEIEVVGIEQVEPDLLLLDIQMPVMDGFEVLRAVGPDRMPHVIFVTAYDQFALRAFEVHALDYLLKPFGDGRFLDAIARAKRAIHQAGRSDLCARLLGLLEAVGLEEHHGAEPTHAATGSSNATHPFVSRIAVKEKGSVFLVRTNEIDWIEAADYYAKLHVRDRDEISRGTTGSCTLFQSQSIRNREFGSDSRDPAIQSRFTDRDPQGWNPGDAVPQPEGGAGTPAGSVVVRRRCTACDRHYRSLHSASDSLR